jgi:hypothetical protein
MSEDDGSAAPGPVRVSRRVPASAAVLFRILSDPGRHTELDGTGMLRGAVTAGPVTAVGDVFTMRMHYSKLGDYEMDNHVVEFEPDRRIAWEPVAGRGHPDVGQDDARWGHRWGYTLEPAGLGATLVTETYDCSSAPLDEQIAMEFGRVWIGGMERTLEQLERVAAAAAPPAASP